jgi:hypothetical protein
LLESPAGSEREALPTPFLDMRGNKSDEEEAAVAAALAAALAAGAAAAVVGGGAAVGGVGTNTLLNARIAFSFLGSDGPDLIGRLFNGASVGKRREKKSC